MRALNARGWTVSKMAVALLGITAIGVLYRFLGTAGQMTHFPKPETEYYAQLATAFADGHTDLILAPDPSITSDRWALFNRYWDLSLHHGKLFLYWGPVPALLDAAMLRAFAAQLTDGQLTIVFAFLRALVGALILVKAKKCFFSAHAWWPTCLGIATFVLGAPIPLVLARASVYEAAIAGAQCFLLIGTYFAFAALTVRRQGTTQVFLLSAAGVCWALAMGCRLSQAFAGLALAGLTLAAVARTPVPARGRALLGPALALACPLAAFLVLNAAYNRVRFGSIFDNGIPHQLSYLHYHAALRFVLPNLYTYAIKPPAVGHDFPFLSVAPWNGFFLWKWVPDLALDRDDFHFEPNAGCLWSTPFFAFSIVAWLSLLRLTFSWLKRRTKAPLSPAPLLGWFIGSSFALGALGFAPCLVSFASTARYLLDMTAGLTLSATVGLSLLAARPCRRRAFHGVLAACTSAAVVVSIVVNLAFWVGGPYGDSLPARNKALFDALSRMF